MFDQLVPDLPFVRRREFDQLCAVAYTQASGGGYVAAPITNVTTIEALILSVDQPVTVRLAGQTDAGTQVSAGGILVFFPTSIDNSGGDGVKVNNASGSTVHVRGVALGS